MKNLDNACLQEVVLPRYTSRDDAEVHQGTARRRIGRAELRRVVLASVVGSFVEWFEFSVYGYLAAVMGRVFFPANAPETQIVASFAAFAAFAAVSLHGHLGA